MVIPVRHSVVNKKFATRALIGIGALIVVVLIGMMIRNLIINKNQVKKPVVHQIALMKPPPPPKIEEKPPEPEVKKEEVKVPEPEQQPEPQSQDDQPAGKDLGVDADGAAGSDSFGLVGKKGGKDLLSGGHMQFAFYTNILQQHVQERLARNKRLRASSFNTTVKVWLSKDGSIQRVELTGTSGDAEVDELIKTAISDIPALKESPPENMPLPVKLRISSRNAG